MKGSAITGPVGKEAAELWPVSFYPLLKIFSLFLTCPSLAYCQQLRCRHVKRLLNERRDFFFIYQRERNEKKTNDQVPRCDLIEAWKSLSRLLSLFSDFLFFGAWEGEKRNGKVKSLDWQALAFRLRRVRMIQYQVSHQTDKDKKISKSESFL